MTNLNDKESLDKCMHGHHGGSLKLVSTMLTNLVSLELFHHNPMGMKDSGLSIISPMTQGIIGLVEMSFTEPYGGLKLFILCIIKLAKMYTF